MRQLLFARSPRLLCVLLVLGFSSAHTGHARPQSHKPVTSVTLAQQEGIQIQEDGSYRLAPDAAPPPPAALFDSTTDFQRYGFLLLSPQSLAHPTNRLKLQYDADVPAATDVRVDVRTSTGGETWSSWEVGVANGGEIDLLQTARQVQYRVTLLGDSRHSPTLRRVEAIPTTGSASYRTMSEQARPVAPTFRVRATRMGMVGGRTANGHIIKPHDHYVSLPSWKSLSSKNGHEYQVRITYNGRSAIAPVWDVGPWNVHDNYWDEDRERFKDLRRGWPQDHAAYFEGYNGRRAEKGYVRFPTAVDVGDGVWWDDLGITSARAEVDITFLWLGDDPQAASPPAETPAAPTEAAPTEAPAATSVPTTTATTEPTVAATSVPTATEEAPTSATAEPAPSASAEPSASPDAPPSAEPTTEVTAEPTVEPTATNAPSNTAEQPSEASTATPAASAETPAASPPPSATPSPVATAQPTAAATEVVTATAKPTAPPAPVVTASPTVSATDAITATPPITAETPLASDGTAPPPKEEPNNDSTTQSYDNSTLLQVLYWRDEWQWTTA